MSAQNFIGQRLFGDYEITKLLGEGGMGSVYLAKNPVIGHDIAVKFLHGSAAQSSEIRQRFQREAQVITMLSHPNIVRVLVFGRIEPRGNVSETLYMAMEFVRGGTLREKLAKGLLDEITVIKILKQCCSALAEAHDLKIVHRDLKPDNILLMDFRGEANFVKVLDFGIAKLVDQGSQEHQLTQAGIVYGTPEYLSPEQAQAQPLDQRTDIYSLGVILYEMMTGKVPFQSSSAVQVLTMHVFNPPTPAEQVAPNRVSPTMAAIINKAMAKDPKQRFGDAMELFRALDAREREILAEGRVSASAAYYPGNELTGIFQAVPTQAPHGVGVQPQGQASQQGPSANFPQAAPPQQMQRPASSTVATSAATQKKIMIAVIVAVSFALVAVLVAVAFFLVK